MIAFVQYGRFIATAERGYAPWLTAVAWASLLVGFACFAIIAIDALRHPQHMWIMNLVWPITALYASGIALWAYFRIGRLSTKARVMEAKRRGEEDPGKRKSPYAMYAIAATHCGSGCTLGDIIAEWSIYLFPPVLAWFGYRTLFEHKIFSAWVLDFILAFVIGIVFQYFTIVPMRNLSPGKGIVQAIKADTLSLIAWQLGMYGWMAVATFAILGHEIEKTNPIFWFMMQIAMLCGFVTSYPVNAWLVRADIKERM
jgi:hypothetical protein